MLVQYAEKKLQDTRKFTYLEQTHKETTISYIVHLLNQITNPIHNCLSDFRQRGNWRKQQWPIFQKKFLNGAFKIQTF